MRGYHHPSSIITLRNALMAGGKCCVFVWFCFCCPVWFKLPCKPVSPLVQRENTLWTVPSNMLGPINMLGQWTETDAQRVPPANGDDLLYCAVLVQCDPGWPDMVLSNLTHSVILWKLYLCINKIDFRSYHCWCQKSATECGHPAETYIHTRVTVMTLKFCTTLRTVSHQSGRSRMCFSTEHGQWSPAWKRCSLATAGKYVDKHWKLSISPKRFLRGVISWHIHR